MRYIQTIIVLAYFSEAAKIYFADTFNEKLKLQKICITLLCKVEKISTIAKLMLRQLSNTVHTYFV